MVASITNLRLHVTSYLERPGDGDAVRVLEVPSDGQSRGNPRHPHAAGLERFGEIQRGRLAFDVGAGRQDDFLNSRRWHHSGE